MTRTRDITCDLEIDGRKQTVCVEYSASSGSPGSYFEPEDPPEIEIENAYLDDSGRVITLTDKQVEIVEGFIFEAIHDSQSDDWD